MSDVAGEGLDGFRRGSLVLPSGEVFQHSFFEGTVSSEHGWMDAMVDSSDPEAVRRLLPRLREVAGRSREFTARALEAVADAIVEELVESESGAEGLADDLVPQTLEALADGTVVLHLRDLSGKRFPEDDGWPTVHFDAAGRVSQVSMDG